MPASGNLLETFLESTAHHRDEAFLLPPTAPAIRYGEMFDRAAALARVVTDLGVGPGDRVVVGVPKSPTAVALYLGCLHAGAIHVPVNPGCTADELRHFVTDADPALVVTDEAGSVLLPGAGPTAVDLHVLEQAAAGVTASAPTPRRGDDVAALLYTSGTTGRPKGAALTHDNLRHNARALHDTWRFTHDDHLLHALPIFHVHGLFVALHCALLAAIPVTFLPRFDVDATIDNLSGTTVFMGVPTYYRRLLDDDRLDATTTATVRLFTSGSAPLPDTLFDAFTARTGHRICERYGMSEAGIITSNPVDGPRVAGTVGFALPDVEMRISDDEGRTVGVGEAGSVEVRGPHLFPGYWRRPDATASAHRTDGWFITGDIGSVDADGRLSLRGRSGDMIISGGENIYPKEIELVLDTVPGIVESAVIGLPHPDLGEAVTAIVVVADEHRPEDLRRALDHSLARYKHPKTVVAVAELPRNTMGKIQKNLLRANHAELYSGGA